MNRGPFVSRRSHVAVLAALLACICFSALEAAASNDPLEELLRKTGEQVSSLPDVLSNMNCIEHVTQEKIGDNGKVAEKEQSVFDYLIILSSASGDLNLVESRVAQNTGKSAPKEKAPLLISNGFSTLFLIFHPYYSPGFKFNLAGEETVSGKTLEKVEFRHIPGTRSPAALAVTGREYPLDISGTAWIDPLTGVIAKISAGLDEGMEDVGLRTLHSEIEYAPVSFPNQRDASWLPARVTVEVESRHQHWRNTHLFSGYKRFSIDTKEQIAQP